MATLMVREPDMNHNHWGIILRFEPGEECSALVHKALRCPDCGGQRGRRLVRRQW